MNRKPYDLGHPGPAFFPALFSHRIDRASR